MKSMEAEGSGHLPFEKRPSWVELIPAVIPHLPGEMEMILTPRWDPQPNTSSVNSDQSLVSLLMEIIKERMGKAVFEF